MSAALDPQIEELVHQLVDVPYFAHRMCGFRCDDNQRDIFDRSNRRTILNCSRQTGKSTTAALIALHTAFFRSGATIVITAPSKQQTREFIRKVRDFAFAAGASLRGGRLFVELKNGSRIVGVAANEDTLRGFSSVALIVIDEASRVKDDVYFALLPMLAVGNGALWILSTPKGKRGFFHTEWNDSSNIEWTKIRTTAHDCPRIPADFLEAQKRRLGERRFAQEFECAFIDTNRGFFHPEIVRKAFKESIQPLDL